MPSTSTSGTRLHRSSSGDRMVTEDEEPATKSRAVAAVSSADRPTWVTLHHGSSGAATVVAAAREDPESSDEAKKEKTEVAGEAACDYTVERKRMLEKASRMTRYCCGVDGQKLHSRHK